MSISLDGRQLGTSEWDHGVMENYQHLGHPSLHLVLELGSGKETCSF